MQELGLFFLGCESKNQKLHSDECEDLLNNVYLKLYSTLLHLHQDKFILYIVQFYCSKIICEINCYTDI